MNYLDKYGDFVNENIFKKWFSPSDEEKRKMGYVKDAKWIFNDIYKLKM